MKNLPQRCWCLHEKTTRRFPRKERENPPARMAFGEVIVVIRLLFVYYCPRDDRSRTWLPSPKKPIQLRNETQNLVPAKSWMAHCRNSPTGRPCGSCHCLRYRIPRLMWLFHLCNNVVHFGFRSAKFSLTMANEKRSTFYFFGQHIYRYRTAINVCGNRSQFRHCFFIAQRCRFHRFVF